MASPLKLPNGAVLVDDGLGTAAATLNLPAGARLVTDTPAQDNEAHISAGPATFSPGWFKEKMYSAVDKGSNMLPAAGGFAGGLIGAGAGAPSGPGAIATGVGGAALGGAGGESARQLIRRAMGWDAPETSLDAAKDIGAEGAKQGAYELGGQVVGRMGKAMAPKMAEVAMAPGKRLLKSVPEGVDIGKTVLNNTTGIRPKTITNQLTSKIADTSAQQDQVLADATQRGITVPLSPARRVVAQEAAAAVKKNAPGYIEDVKQVGDQLANQYGPNGKPLTVATTKPGAGFVPGQVAGPSAPVRLPAAVDPVRARQLRQGVDLTIGGWNPEAQAAIDPLRKRVYGAISDEIHNAVPESAPLDKAMTSMIPAKDAAWNVSYNPSITRNIFNRVARPTGALTGATFGAYEGGKEGGPLGAIGGGLTGLLLPELVSSSAGQMAVARTLNSRLLPRVATNTPRVVGGLSDLFKSSAEEERKKKLASQRQ